MGATIPGRAVVVPTTAANDWANENNMSANGESKATVLLRLTSASDGQPTDDTPQRVTARMSNWLRVVLYYSGSNDGPHEQLPAEVTVPVHLDATTRAIVSLDVDQAEAELAALREVGRQHYLGTDAPLAGVRFARKLPKLAFKQGRELLRDWKSGIRDLRDDLKKPETDADGAPIRRPPKGPAWNPKEVEQARRTAVALRAYLDLRPKEFEAQRASALEVGPTMVTGVIDGWRHPEDFEHWLMYSETSGVITPEEAAAWRAQAVPPVWD